MTIRLVDFITSVACLRSDLVRRGYPRLANYLDGIPMTVEGAVLASRLLGQLPKEVEGAPLITAKLMTDLVLRDEKNPRPGLKSPIEMAA